MTRFGALTLLLLALPNSHQLNSHGSQLQRPADTVTALVSTEGKSEQLVDIDQLKAAQTKGGKPVAPLSAKVKTAPVKSEIAKKPAAKQLINVKKMTPPVKVAPPKKSGSAPPSNQLAAIGQTKKSNLHLTIGGKAQSVAKHAQPPAANSKIQNVMSSILGKYKKQQAVAQEAPALVVQTPAPAPGPAPAPAFVAPEPTPVEPAQPVSSLAAVAAAPTPEAAPVDVAAPSALQQSEPKASKEDAAKKAIMATLAKIKSQQKTSKPQQQLASKAPLVSSKPAKPAALKPAQPEATDDMKSVAQLNTEALEYSESALGTFDAENQAQPAQAAQAQKAATPKTTATPQKAAIAPKKPQLAGLKTNKKVLPLADLKTPSVPKPLAKSVPKVPPPKVQVAQKKALSKSLKPLPLKKIAVANVLKSVANAHQVAQKTLSKKPLTTQALTTVKKPIKHLDKAALETSSEIHQSSKILKQIKKKTKTSPLMAADQEKKLVAAQQKFQKLSEMATQARSDVMEKEAAAQDTLETHQVKLEEQKQKQLDLQWQALENEKYLNQVKQHTDATSQKIQQLKTPAQPKPVSTHQALLQKKVDPTIEENKAFLASTTQFQDGLKQKEEALKVAKDTQEVAEKQKEVQDEDDKKKASLIEEQNTQAEVMKQATETQAKIEGKNTTQATANLLDPTALDNVEPEASPITAAPATAPVAAPAPLSQSELIAKAIKHQQASQSQIESPSEAQPTAAAAEPTPKQEPLATAEVQNASVEPLKAAPVEPKTAAQSEEATFTKSAADQQIIQEALTSKAVPTKTKEQIKQIMNETHPQALQEASVSELTALSLKHKQLLDEPKEEPAAPPKASAKALAANKTSSVKVAPFATTAQKSVSEPAPATPSATQPSTGAISMQDQINQAVKHQLEAMKQKPNMQETASALSSVASLIPEPATPQPTESTVSGQSLADQMASVLKGFGSGASQGPEPTPEDKSQSQQIVAQVQADAKKKAKGAATKDTTEIAKSLISSVQDLMDPAEAKQPDQDQISVTQQKSKSEATEATTAADTAVETAAADPETQKQEQAILKTEDKLLKRLAKNEKKLEKKLKKQQKEEAATSKKSKKVAEDDEEQEVKKPKAQKAVKKVAKPVVKAKIATVQKKAEKKVEKVAPKVTSKIPKVAPKAIAQAAETKLLSKSEPKQAAPALSLAGSREEETAAEDAPPTYTPADFMSPDSSKVDEIIIDDEKTQAEHRYADDLIHRKEHEIQALQKIEESGSHQLEKLSAKRDELKSASTDLDAVHKEVQEKKAALHAAATDLRRGAATHGPAHGDKQRSILSKFREEAIARRREQQEELRQKQLAIEQQRQKIQEDRRKAQQLDHEQQQLSAAGQAVQEQMHMVKHAQEKVRHEIQRAKVNADAEKEERLEWDRREQERLEHRRAILEAEHARRLDAHEQQVREASERVQQDCGESRSVVERGCEYDPQSGFSYQVVTYIVPSWNSESGQCEESEQQRMVHCQEDRRLEFDRPSRGASPYYENGFLGSFAQASKSHRSHNDDDDEDKSLVVKSSKQIRSEVEAASPSQVDEELKKRTKRSATAKKKDTKASEAAKKVIKANEGSVKEKLTHADAVLKSLKSLLAK